MHDPRHKNYIETDIAKDDDGELMGDRTHEFYEDIMRTRNNRYNQKYDQIHNQIFDELTQTAKPLDETISNVFREVIC